MGNFSEQTRFSLEEGILLAVREGEETAARALKDVQTCMQQIINHRVLFVLVINRTSGILNFTDFMAMAEEWREFSLKSYLRVAFVDQKPSGASDIAILESICSIKGFHVRFYTDPDIAMEHLRAQQKQSHSNQTLL